jgi:hypothetical protein
VLTNLIEFDGSAELPENAPGRAPGASSIGPGGRTCSFESEREGRGPFFPRQERILVEITLGLQPANDRDKREKEQSNTSP